MNCIKRNEVNTHDYLPPLLLCEMIPSSDRCEILGERCPVLWMQLLSPSKPLPDELQQIKSTHMSGSIHCAYTFRHQLSWRVKSSGVERLERGRIKGQSPSSCPDSVQMSCIKRNVKSVHMIIYLLCCCVR